MQTVQRLSTEAFSALKKQAGYSPSCNTETTPLQAGFQLGLARVLELLREGFVVESNDTKPTAEPPGGR